MKKSISFLLAIIMLMTSLSVGMTAFASDLTTANVEVTYHQSDARSMLSMVNNFRKSKDAWYWNTDNKTKVNCNNLSNLVYDYELERIAMQRAAEIVLKFSHTRPNGEICWTAYPQGSYSVCSENIAAGQRTAESAFISWREDNDNYSGQGHRRNMLNGSVTAIGIACVEYNGIRYWVQEFRAPTRDTKQVNANDSKTNVKINIRNSDINYGNVSVSTKSISLKAGQSAQLPVVTAEISTKDTWPSSVKIQSTITPEWTSGNKYVADIVNGKIVARKGGSTSISANVLGKTISFTVKVEGNGEECKHNGGYEWLNGAMIKKQCSECGEILVTLPFNDISKCAIYGDYIEYTSVNNKFITGTNPPARTQFSPTTPITRAMFVTILYRMAGEPYANGKNPHRTTPFTDIKDKSVYYYDAACWALDKGITTQTTFKPFDNVSREQTASFLFRYAQSNGKVGDTKYKSVNLKSYPDYNNVSSWAVEALQWANYNGMITGTQQGYINPQGATQRIHATKILYGFGKTCNIGNFA